MWERQERPPGLLLKNDELVEGERWALENKASLTASERLFLAASRGTQTIAERERLQAGRIRRFAVAATIIGAVALVAGVLAAIQWRAALQQKQKAEDLARTAVAGSLLSAGRATQGNLTLLEIRQPGRTPTATATLHKALATPHVITLEGHGRVVTTASWSPDGRRVVTASWDKTARIWNPENGDLLATLSGHAAQWSPDGRRVVTASDDKTARIWNPENGDPLATLSGHSSSVNAAQWSPDGRQIVTSSLDSTARIWVAGDTAELQGRIRARTHRCLKSAFRQRTFGEPEEKAAEGVAACEKCVPVFFDLLGDAARSDGRAYEEAWGVCRECLGR